MNDLTKQLKIYRSRTRSWFEFLKCMRTRYNKEQNATVKFVIPLFSMLGWDPLTADMEFEYFIPGEKKRGGKVDVALFVGRSKAPKFLIEVKPFQNKSVDNRWTQVQIFRYLVKSKSYYGIVTNGRELVLYGKRYVRPDYKRPRKFLSLKADDFVKYEKVLRVFSKSMVKNGEFDKLAKAYNSNLYWSWRKNNLSGNKTYDEYQLPLEFAVNFLANL